MPDQDLRHYHAEAVIHDRVVRAFLAGRMSEDEMRRALSKLDFGADYIAALANQAPRCAA
ncbi:MAG: hypothetical protein A2516_10045 [Alphaproteobacteria bacterium RIFOXYD12_FULL_60_8]|nr:MAG: hypothetical protein A2516_10045 [Alphaproteobacteria bacterium RIFOXYD12_FULL_60_8]